MNDYVMLLLMSEYCWWICCTTSGLVFMSCKCLAISYSVMVVNINIDDCIMERNGS